MFWNLRCPAGHVADALRHVKAADPKASVMLAVAPEMGTKAISMFPWFDPRERSFAHPTSLLTTTQHRSGVSWKANGRGTSTSGRA
jgi:hypothetical protein